MEKLQFKTAKVGDIQDADFVGVMKRVNQQTWPMLVQVRGHGSLLAVPHAWMMEIAGLEYVRSASFAGHAVDMQDLFRMLADDVMIPFGSRGDRKGVVLLCAEPMEIIANFLWCKYRALQVQPAALPAPAEPAIP